MLTVLDFNAYVVFSYYILDLLSNFQEVVSSEYSFDDFVKILMFVNLQTVINIYYLLSASCENIDQILKC